jgi:hypothetical protein
VFDEERLARDAAYARRWANANQLTSLTRHSDSNQGNLLNSTETGDPRVYSVDNRVAFQSEASDRGTRWRDLQLDRLPATALTRLRSVTEDELDVKLGVLIQFEIRAGELVRTAPSANVDRDEGVRRRGDVIQLGLTRTEIEALGHRIEKLLEDVDRGRIQPLAAAAEFDESRRAA